MRVAAVLGLIAGAAWAQFKSTVPLERPELQAKTRERLLGFAVTGALFYRTITKPVSIAS